MNIRRGLGLIFFLSLIALMGCNVPKNDAETNAQLMSDLYVFKSYKVPDRLAREINQTINDLLSTLEPKIGSVKLTPDGQLLVVAPNSFHEGVKAFIEQINIDNPVPSPSVEVNYWIVAGREAKMPAKLDEFNRIKPALETIQNNQGNMEFKLLDHVVLTSSTQGTRTYIGGTVVRINQMYSAYSDGSLTIQPSIDLMGTALGNINTIDTNIETRSGELVVLGQSSQGFVNRPIFEPKEEGTKRDVERVNVYYIISADVKK